MPCKWPSCQCHTLMSGPWDDSHMGTGSTASATFLTQSHPDLTQKPRYCLYGCLESDNAGKGCWRLPEILGVGKVKDGKTKTKPNPEEAGSRRTWTWIPGGGAEQWSSKPSHPGHPAVVPRHRDAASAEGPWACLAQVKAPHLRAKVTLGDLAACRWSLGDKMTEEGNRNGFEEYCQWHLPPAPLTTL